MTVEQPSAQSFRIDWDPTAKGRPKFSVIRGRAIVRTPEKTAAAEAAIRWYLTAKHAVAYAPTVPLQVRAVFMFRRPPSAPKSRTRPVTKPDADNCFKLLSDAANDILWQDQQIVTVAIEKRYCPDGVAPHILLDVVPIDDSPVHLPDPRPRDREAEREAELARKVSFGV